MGSVSRSPSRSEGEYVSSDSEAKAIKPPSRQRVHHIDRHSRTHSTTQGRHTRSRSRSPYRAPRGEKRRREDEYNKRHDPRTFSVRYDDDRRAPISQSDRQSKKSRTYSPSRDRSRSPYRRTGSKDDKRDSGSIKQSVSFEERNGEKPRLEKVAKTSDQTLADAGNPSNTSGSEADVLSTVIADETALIEARRKRREAIKNKYKDQEPSLLVQALRVGSEVASRSVDATSIRSVSPLAATAPVSTPGTPRSVVSEAQSPSSSALSKDDVDSEESTDAIVNADEPSAADYDPTFDMQEERARHDKRLFKEDEQSIEEADQQVLEKSDAPLPSEGDAELDMFAEGDDDMFAENPVRQVTVPPSASRALNTTMLDNWDDPQGYYLTILGELIDGRYKVTQNLGRGMFASVVRAIDVQSDQTVAIKIIRNNESMRKAGMKEIDILQNLAANDPEDKLHVVRLLRSLDHKAHLCMVFENMSMNLREVLKKYGRDVGISLKSIRAYSQQLFRGLSLLKKCQFLHADLKPDNILVTESRSVVKIADLGSASPISENAIAPYLVSRFYRAPEIILGIPYDYGIDMWSIGCTLFELYTGRILFTGRNNNNMLRTIMECRGKFPNKLLRKGSLTYDFFDDLLNFKAIEPDKITGQMVAKTVDIKAKPVRDLRSRLMPKGRRIEEQEKQEIELFVDLLDKCLALSPEKRITPSDALKHPFIARMK